MKQNLVIIASVLMIALFIASRANAQWIQTNGPFGGAVPSMVFNGTDLFAAVSAKGVFRSTDSGASWTAMNHGLSDSDVYALAVRPAEDIPTLFAGVFQSPWDSDGVYRSTDNGENWTPARSGLPIGTHILTLGVVGNYLFAGTYGGQIYRSSDDGSNWVFADSGLGIYNQKGTQEVNCFAALGDKVFGGTDLGVFFSTDYGASWNLTSYVSELGKSVNALVVSGSVLYGGTTEQGVIRSTDSGNSWIQVGLTNAIVRSFQVIGTNLFAGTESGVYLSTDSGNTWTETVSGLTCYLVSSFTVIGNSSSPMIFAGSEGGGIYRSNNNGTNWTTSSNGLIYSPVPSFGVIGNSLYAGTDGGVFLTVDSGNSWKTVNNGFSIKVGDVNSPEVTSIATSGKNIYAGTFGGVFHSTDSGTSWTVSSNGLTSSNISAVITNGTNVYAGDDGGMYFSTDSGLNWTAMSSFDNSYGVNSLLALGTSLFVGTQGSEVAIWSEIDSTWTYGSLGSTSRYVYAFASIGSTLFAATSNGVFRSANNANNWISSGLTNQDVSALIAVGTNLFAGTYDSGTYISTDNGTNWTNVSLGLTDSNILTFAMVGSNLYAGTSGAGVWRRPLSEIIPSSSVADPEMNSSSIQSYPNPFTQSTTITFSSPESGVAEVTIVNLLGTQVARLFEGELASGEHTFTWNASSMPTGTYWAIVRMNGRVQQVPIVFQSSE